MSNTETTPEDFTDDDLIFECPFCSKSMAIDKRGMGLTIECPECGKQVKVPTETETEEEDDTDVVPLPEEATTESLEPQLKEINTLKQKLASVEKERLALEKVKEAHEDELAELRIEFGRIQSALDQITIILLDTDQNLEDM